MTTLAMDNFHLDVTAHGEEALTLALALALMAEASAVCWGVSPKGDLVLFWSNPEGDLRWAHPFPSKITKPDALALFVMGWLEEATYPPRPDIDGSTSKGFRVYNDDWGCVNGCGSYAFVAIKPEWVLHGK
jgi:hypothetical protein